MRRAVLFLLTALACLASVSARAQGTQVNAWCLTPYATIGADNYKPCNPTSTITGNAAGTTGAVVGTLAAAAGKVTYICGFSVSAIGGTAAVGPITIAGTVTGSLTYQLASTATGNTLSVPFGSCIPASAVNTQITVTTTADGTASNVSVNSWGFQQ